MCIYTCTCPHRIKRPLYTHRIKHHAGIVCSVYSNKSLPYTQHRPSYTHTHTQRERERERERKRKRERERDFTPCSSPARRWLSCMHAAMPNVGRGWPCDDIPSTQTPQLSFHTVWSGVCVCVCVRVCVYVCVCE